MNGEREREPTDMPSPFERTLLLSARSDAPPSQATERAWLRFSGALARAALSAGPVPAGALARARSGAHIARLSTLKYLALGALGGSALTLAWFQAHPMLAREPAPAPAHSTGVALGSARAAVAPPPERAQASAAAPTHVLPGHTEASNVLRAHGKLPSAVGAQPAPHDAAQEPIMPSSLAAETAALDAARNASATGEFQRALRLLSQYERDFPNGALRGDAEVATIQTLDSAGEHAEAARRAMYFLAQYPNDPHSSTVRRLLSR